MTSAEQALLKALGPEFGARSGEIYFGGSTKEQLSELGFPSVQASIGTISRSAFDAACGARAGLEACEQRELPGGRTVHTRAWADRDAAADEMRGECAAYVQRPVGDVVAAPVLTGGQLGGTDAGRRRSVLLDWFASHEDALATAVTDEQAAAGTS